MDATTDGATRRLRHRELADDNALLRRSCPGPMNCCARCPPRPKTGTRRTSATRRVRSCAAAPSTGKPWPPSPGKRYRGWPRRLAAAPAHMALVRARFANPPQGPANGAEAGAWHGAPGASVSVHPGGRVAVSASQVIRFPSGSLCPEDCRQWPRQSSLWGCMDPHPLQAWV